MPLFQNASYAFSVAGPLDPYPESTAEVAFAGRSNAGKSSALNTLVGHKRLAFVSKTPGRTQMINFFGLGEGRFLVDLPGYGYAKVPEKIRSQWEALLGAYLRHRSTLLGLVLVMDSRHAFSDLDWHMIDFFGPTGKPIHVLLTKADKLTRTEQQTTLASAKHTLAQLSPLHSAQLFSSLKHTGMDETEQTLSTWLGMERKVAEPEVARKVRINPGHSRRPASKTVDKKTSGNKKPRA